MFGQIPFYTHIGSLFLAGSGVLYADKLALSWLRGKRETLQHSHLLQTHYLVSAALATIVVSGIYLFWPMRDYLLGQPLFYLKMFFVLALILNSVVIGKMLHIATLKPFHILTRKEKFPLMVSGTISTLSWVGAILAALVLFD
jgi:hypothetical protein